MLGICHLTNPQHALISKMHVRVEEKNKMYILLLKNHLHYGLFEQDEYNLLMPRF